MADTASQTKLLRQPTPDDLLEEQLMRDWLKQLQEEHLQICYMQGVSPISNNEAELEYPQEDRSVTSPNNRAG